ncbi:MAG: hypothetical protein KZQ89_00425 [Candidatus Thiodiazotropha sp. (ex Lucinoma kastoroae)]|nr:hypothetical protein [Candidatus Thiodiazotropha sp. (ex Lucinoma kastoroae)]
MRRSKKDSNALAQSIIEYAVKLGVLSREFENKRILTTASRYLGNPYFRKTMGIVSGRSDSDVVINVSFDDFDRIVERFIADIMDSASSVTSRTNKSDWESYARTLINEGVAPTSHTDKKKLSDRQSFRKKSNLSDGDDSQTGNSAEGNIY